MARKGHVLYARLRLENSALNLDHYQKHNIFSHSYQCGNFEMLLLSSPTDKSIQMKDKQI